MQLSGRSSWPGVAGPVLKVSGTDLGHNLGPGSVQPVASHLGSSLHIYPWQRPPFALQGLPRIKPDCMSPSCPLLSLHSVPVLTQTHVLSSWAMATASSRIPLSSPAHPGHSRQVLPLQHSLPCSPVQEGSSASHCLAKPRSGPEHGSEDPLQLLQLFPPQLPPLAIRNPLFYTTGMNKAALSC